MIVYYRFRFGKDSFCGKGELVNNGKEFVAIKVRRPDGSIRYTTIPRRWIYRYSEGKDENR